MWIFLDNSLLSIIDQGDPSGATLLVRAWRDDDIRALFPDARVIEDSGSDRTFSARIERRVVTEVIADQIESIRTPDPLASFQGCGGHGRHADLWQAVGRQQQREAGR
jgi:hypothetical protein